MLDSVAYPLNDNPVIVAALISPSLFTVLTAIEASLAGVDPPNKLPSTLITSPGS